MSGRAAPPGGRTRDHMALGAFALVALLALTLTTTAGRRARLPALVRASQVFTLASLEPGRYMCTLRDNRRPGGSTLVWQRVLEFERSDLVELRLDPVVVDGDRIAAGQRLATLGSLHTAHRLRELEAEREALAARRALLVAGGLPAEVEAAETRVAVARAELDAAASELARGRALADSGLISDLDLETLQRDHEVCRLEIERHQAEVTVAQDAARPEALAALDAEIDAVAAQIAELRRLGEEKTVRAPISGIARVGADGHEVEVLAVDELYLSMLINPSEGSEHPPGTRVQFFSSVDDSSPDVGEVVSLGSEMVVHNGRPAMWVTAVFRTDDAHILPGHTGMVELPARSAAPTVLASLRRRVGELP